MSGGFWCLEVMLLGCRSRQFLVVYDVWPGVLRPAHLRAGVLCFWVARGWCRCGL